MKTYFTPVAKIIEKEQRQLQTGKNKYKQKSETKRKWFCFLWFCLMWFYCYNCYLPYGSWTSKRICIFLTWTNEGVKNFRHLLADILKQLECCFVVLFCFSVCCSSVWVALLFQLVVRVFLCCIWLPAVVYACLCCLSLSYADVVFVNFRVSSLVVFLSSAAISFLLAYCFRLLSC